MHNSYTIPIVFSKFYLKAFARNFLCISSEACKCCHRLGSNASSLIFPSNKAVIVGKIASLRCMTTEPNFSIAWEYFSPASTTKLNVYNGYKITRNFTEMFKISRETTSHRDLISINTQLSHAGTYVCRKLPVDSNSAAELVILGKIKFKLCLYHRFLKLFWLNYLAISTIVNIAFDRLRYSYNNVKIFKNFAYYIKIGFRKQAKLT